MKDLHLERAVRLPGFREDVLSLVKSADLFVMSSVTEGLGSAVLDAMAMGLAVVGTRAGGIPEAVVHGSTGLLVPPGEPKPLAAAIVRLLKDPLLRSQYGHAGRARVEEHFGVDKLVEGTLAVYHDLVGGERSRRPARAIAARPGGLARRHAGRQHLARGFEREGQRLARDAGHERPDDPAEPQRNAATERHRFALDVDAAVAFVEAPVAVDAPEEAAIVPDRQLVLGGACRRPPLPECAC